jgi:hypothetical protein
MNCRSVINSLSAHLDGVLAAEERQALLSHLRGCQECAARLAGLSSVRSAVGSLPVRPVPPALTTKVRVIASKERERVLARQRPLEALVDRFRLWADNLMRPLALPFAGGLLSAIVLFSILIPTFAFRPVSSQRDVPVGIMTEPMVKASMPFRFDTDVSVEALIDGQGRMVDYTITKGAVNDPEMRRSIENYLVFTEFTPATMLGSPTLGRISISFQRTTIEIKS